MDRLQELYGQLIDLIPEEQIDHYLACGCSAGKDYDLMSKRLLVVEKLPKAADPSKTGSSAGDCRRHGGLGSGNLNSTDFTEAVGKISRHLLNIAPDKWPDSIAKTYLYKVAPMQGKPSAELLRQQHDLCRRILLEEIRVYDPTHVLFLTGWSGVWDFDFPVYPLLKGEMVEAVGKADNGAQILVSRYAIRDSEDKFVADIVSAFRTLDDAENK